MEDIVNYVIIAICAIIAVIQILQRGSISKGVKSIMTFEQKQLLNKERKGQEFSEFVDDLKYNEKTGVVDVVGQKNIQAEIDSSLNTSLDVYLQRFIDDEASEDVDKKVDVSTTSLESAYDAMLRAADVAEAYAREKKMNNASLVEIMRAINSEYKAKAQAKPDQVVKDEKKETEQESKQA